MDMKNLMQKLESINQKKTLAESKKVTKPKMDKEEKNIKSSDAKKKPVKESIRQQLLRAFGLTEATNPHPPGSPQAAAWDNLTPQDQEWIGGGDPTDKTILSRAPNKGMSAAGAGQAAAAGAAAQQAASQQQQQQQADARQDAEASAAAASAMNDVDQQYSMGKPTDSNVNPRDMALAKGQVTTPAAPSGQAAQKAAPVKDPNVLALQQKLIAAGAKNKDGTPLKADGIMGPATQAAIKQFPAVATSMTKVGQGGANQTAAMAAKTGVNLSTSAAGGGRGGQGGPTADELAKAGTNPQIAKIDAEIKRFSSKNDMNIEANKNYVAGLEKKKAALAGQPAASQAAQPAAAPASRPAPKPGELGSGTTGPEGAAFGIYPSAKSAAPSPAPAAYQGSSVRPGQLGSGTYGVSDSINREDDAILERIRNISFK